MSLPFSAKHKVPTFWKITKLGVRNRFNLASCTEMHSFVCLLFPNKHLPALLSQRSYHRLIAVVALRLSCAVLFYDYSLKVNYHQ